MRLRFFAPLTAVVIGTLCLAGCVSTPMPVKSPPVDYAAMQPLRFDVAEVFVINDAPTTTATQQLSQYGQSPEDAMRNWANKRIEAVGERGSYSLIIKDANFAVTKLPVKSGISGWMERQQAERWDAFLNVMIAVEGSASMLPPADITINVRSSHTLPEDASDEEKRLTYTAIMNKLMTLYNAEAQKQMDAYFRAYYM